MARRSGAGLNNRHQPHITNRNERLRFQLHGSEPAVDEIRAVCQDLQLAAPAAIEGEELLDVLEVVMSAIASLAAAQPRRCPPGGR